MSLDVLDWRRRVHDLYAEVRAAADPASAHERWRGGRDDLLANHPASPLTPEDRASFGGLPYAPYDPTLRFEVAVESAEPAHIELPTSADGAMPSERIGVVTLGDLGTLDVWWLESYAGGVFLPVKDRNPQTYGGGRYVLDTVKGADLGSTDGRLVVDLNFAYSPSCAYNPVWTCPLAPPGNALDVEVVAGELVRSKT